MKRTALVTVLSVLTLCGSFTAQESRAVARKLVASQAATLTVSSPAFADGHAMPQPYGAEGDNFSPALEWKNAPAATQSFVVMMEDPDAATPKPFVHWTVYNLPATVTRLHESIPAVPQLPQLNKARQGRNSHGTIGYTGPRPPKSDPPHHYHFQVFALDTPLILPPAADALAIIDAMKGHVLASGEIIGLFNR